MSDKGISLPKTYDPSRVEGRIYEWWESKGYFSPQLNPWKKPFVISMPPPNVTGQLHLGHAITATLEDIMIRYHRMLGDPTLWVPGADHAGIATQNVVERELAKEGVKRTDLGRDKFVERVWQWKGVYLKRIDDQHRRLGVSCDWKRERFTLDEGLSHAVRTAFVRLYNKQLIYRGTYLVNWCPRCQTALSDLEVEHDEQATHLWYVRYPLIDDGWPGPQAPWPDPGWCDGATQFITVATTRPETLLGDTAVAVHPDDERFKGLVGLQAVLPGIGRRIPIIADAVVDREFGTGAVKVTPAHDPTDYEIGKRQNLPESQRHDRRRADERQRRPVCRTGSVRLPRADCRRPDCDRDAGQDRALYALPGSLSAVCDSRRTENIDAMVCQNQTTGRAGDPGGARRPDSHRAGAIRKGVL